MKSREIAWLAFTEKGHALAQRLCASLGGEVSYTGDGVSLRDWTGKAFAESRALVFIGAAGIAVRASAPYLTGKAADPADASAQAVPVVDEAAPVPTYTVQEGDDLTDVSIRFGVSAAAVRELNNLGENDKLVAGQILKLPADAQQQ